MKIILIFFLLSLIYIGTAVAAMDYSDFDLKPHQLSLLVKLEAKGKDEAYLLKMAKGFHLYNTTGSSTEEQETEYIPPHTDADLLAVQQWAKGGAFSSFLSFTNLSFDSESYRADCPDWAVFNFGRATGMEYLKRDVLKGAINMMSELQYHYANNRDGFEQKFLELAKREGFESYFF